MNEQHKYIFFGATPALVIGLGSGIAIGLFITKKKIETKYLEISNTEIAEAKKFYAALYKKDEFETPESAVESLGLTGEVEKSKNLMTNATKAMTNYQGTEVVVKKNKNKNKGDRAKIIESVSIETEVVPTEQSEVVHNIFVDSLPIEPDDFDYEEEVKRRDPDLPYIITKEEFFENDPYEHDQLTITYYSGDDVLVDEKDVVIPNSDTVVGDNNLLKFGHGSGDPRLVYIRNENLNLDFEVVGNNGTYTEQVLGFMKHGDNTYRKSRKSRGDDD